MKLLIAGGLAALLASPSSAADSLNTLAPSASGADTGKIQIKATWDGKLPDPLPALRIEPAAAKGCCAEGVQVDAVDRRRRIDALGGVADVVFTFSPKSGEVEAPLREEPVVINQRECHFEPHITVVRVGETVRYMNSDSTNHNVNVKAKKNGSFNNNVAAGGKMDKKLEKAERITIGCDIHPWMSATVVVTDAVYHAVSGLDGGFTVEGVQPGTYSVEWWHETLGKGKLDDVSVTAGETAEVAHKLKEGGGGGARRRRR